MKYAVISIKSQITYFCNYENKFINISWIVFKPGVPAQVGTCLVY